LLVTSLRDFPSRHRSMRAVIDRSWQMLTEDERAAFKRLSVFRGGFFQQAAVAIAGADFTLLASLVDKSFLHHAPSGRYEVHELLRQFGEEKLSTDENAQARNRHCHYFAGFLQQRTEDLRHGRMKEMLNELAEEIENVRAAWNWATQHRQVEEIAASYQSLYRFYELRSRFQEGEIALEQGAQALTAAANGTRECALRAGILWRQARFCQRLALFDKAKILLDASLDLSQRNRLRREAGYALKELGILGLLRGEYAQSQENFQRGLAVFREAGDELDVCAALVNLGYAACQMGQYEAAARSLEEGLAIAQKLRAPEAIGFALCYLGLVSRGLGNTAEAKQRFQQALTSYREIGHAWGMALCSHCLANLATEAGEYDEATRLAEEGLANAKKIGDPNSTSLCLNRLGEIACARKEYDAANRYHLQAVETAWKAKQTPPVLEGLIGLAALCAKTARADVAYELLTLVVHHPATVARERDRAEHLLAELESQLAPEAIAAAHERGGIAKLEEAVEKLVALA
ncbi:MAG: tetratricopeptide repeat protein, partial [Chloroflexota bacterium]|nr:tetratricopeptide repeat protein [Chloroflexota bacterium]